MSDVTHEQPAIENDWVDPDHTGATDDAWHRHLGEHAPQHAHGATSPRSIILVGLVCFAILCVTVVGLIFYFHEEVQKAQIAKGEKDLGIETAQIKTEAQEDLKTYGWADPEAGLVTIPLEQAQKQIQEEYAEEE